MKKTTFSVILLIICLFSSFGQYNNELITMRKDFPVYQFYQNNIILNTPQLIKTIGTNEQAYNELNKNRSTLLALKLVGAAGGIMIIYSIGEVVIGKKADLITGGIGVGLVLFSIHLSKKVKNRVRIAGNTFNNRLKTKSKSDNINLDLGYTGNSIGLYLRF